MNKNVVATISQGEYRDDLLNKKCLRRLMNTNQSQDFRMGTYKINKITLSCFDDKIHIANNGYHGFNYKS